MNIGSLLPLLSENTEDPTCRLREKWDVIIRHVKRFSPWTTESELAWLAELASGCEAIAEVGSYKGKSGKVLAHACKGRVICVDRFQDNTEAVFRTNLETEIESGKVTLHAMESGDASALVEDGSLDAVFIDASHTEDDVARDIDLWLPKVKSGGVVCGHDFESFGANNPNPVGLAVTKKLPGFTRPVDTIWAWQNHDFHAASGKNYRAGSLNRRREKRCLHGIRPI